MVLYYKDMKRKNLLLFIVILMSVLLSSCQLLNNVTAPLVNKDVVFINPSDDSVTVSSADFANGSVEIPAKGSDTIVVRDTGNKNKMEVSARGTYYYDYSQVFYSTDSRVTLSPNCAWFEVDNQTGHTIENVVFNTDSTNPAGSQAPLYMDKEGIELASKVTPYKTMYLRVGAPNAPGSSSGYLCYKVGVTNKAKDMKTPALGTSSKLSLHY